MFPWQAMQWQVLWQRYQQRCLPHALLFSGIAGIGKKQFAESFANAILCRYSDKAGKSCRQCHACHLTQAGTHPDKVYIEPEQDGHTIKIDLIREAVHLVNETSLQSGFKIIIISPANTMNTAASNALLKTLEEPTPNTLFILITDQSARLPATIASRCQKIVFQKPNHEAALQWLQTQSISSDVPLDLLLNLSEGAPLKAKKFIEDGTLALRNDFYQGLVALSRKSGNPLQLAAQWHGQDMRLLLNLLLSWLRDILRVTLIGQTEIINSDYQNEFVNLKLSRKNLISYLDKVQQLCSHVMGSLNLNKQLILEELLIQWLMLMQN
jgi:DNA polymerase-3 subunit delta'